MITSHVCRIQAKLLIRASQDSLPLLPTHLLCCSSDLSYKMHMRPSSMMTLNTAKVSMAPLSSISSTPILQRPSADCILSLRLLAVSLTELVSHLLSALMAVSLHLEAVPGHTVVLLGSVVISISLHVTASSTGGTPITHPLIAHLPSPGCLVSAFRPHSGLLFISTTEDNQENKSCH